MYLYAITLNVGIIFKFMRQIYCFLIFFILLYTDIDDPIIYVNDEWVSDRITVDILEGKPFHMSCFVEGNPTRQFVLDSLQI